MHYEPKTITLTEGETFYSADANGCANVRYSTITKIARYRDLLIFMQGKYLATPIPMRTFSDDAQYQAFVDVLEERTGCKLPKR